MTVTNNCNQSKYPISCGLDSQASDFGIGETSVPAYVAAGIDELIQIDFLDTK